ncbi:MAG: hypothetical protein LBM93_07920 [Oscillospiraceae bacterium]|jgi:hypothetical protein|nr:hypothetical protein [Oscillospiraceae bacterium]
MKKLQNTFCKEILFYTVLWFLIAFFLPWWSDDLIFFFGELASFLRDIDEYPTPIIYSNVITPAVFCLNFRKNRFYLNVAFCGIMSLICLGLYFVLWFGAIVLVFLM